MLGWGIATRIRKKDRVGSFALAVSGLTLVCSIAAWIDFSYLHTYEAHDHWDFLTRFMGETVFIIDEFNAPLLPLASLI